MYFFLSGVGNLSNKYLINYTWRQIIDENILKTMNFYAIMLYCKQTKNTHLNKRSFFVIQSNTFSYKELLVACPSNRLGTGMRMSIVITNNFSRKSVNK